MNEALASFYPGMKKLVLKLKSLLPQSRVQSRVANPFPLAFQVHIKTK
jgi:hypothetical protein